MWDETEIRHLTEKRFNPPERVLAHRRSGRAAVEESRRRHPSHHPRPGADPYWTHSGSGEHCARCHRAMREREPALVDSSGALHCELCGHRVWANHWEHGCAGSRAKVVSLAEARRRRRAGS